MTEPEVKVLMLKGDKGDGLSDDDMKKVSALISSSVANAEASINNSLNARLADARYIPEIFANADELKSKYPTGKDGIFIAADTGHMWLFVNGNWIDGGVYQVYAMTSDQKWTINGALHGTQYVYDESTLANFKDADQLPRNSIISYVYGMEKLVNVPTGNTGTIITFSSKEGRNYDEDNTTVQLAVTTDGDSYVRRKWNSWGTWKKINNGLNAEVNIYTSSLLVAPYKDTNTLPKSSMVTYSYGNFPDNLPVQGGSWYQILTSDNHAGVITQTCQIASGDCYIRCFNENDEGERTNFVDWEKINNGREIANLDSKITQVETKLTESFASFSIFQKFAVIGDSYASAALGINPQWSVFQDGGSAHRWGQMIATRYGLTYTHLAAGGLSTRTWLTSDSGLKAMQSADPQDLYMLCLGINDYYGLGIDYLGSESDMESGADTFYGNYAKIIKAIQTKAPKGKLIMYGVADDSSVANSFRDAQQKIAAHFGIPFISEREDPLFVSEFYTSNMEGGHPRVPVYGAMSKAMVRLTEKVIDQNEHYFHDIGWN